MFKRIVLYARHLGFTKNEITVLFFIVGALCTGEILSLVRGTKEANKSDYKEQFARHDSLFSARAMAEEIMREIDSVTVKTNKRSDRSAYTEKKGSNIVGCIDINKAGEAELIKLPGVGEATVKKIINQRKTIGRFSKIEDIMNVNGIGEKKFEKMKSYLCINE